MNAAADAVGVDVRYLKGVVTVELSQNDSGEYNGVMTLQAYAAHQQTAEKILNALLGRLDRCMIKRQLLCAATVYA